MFSVATPQEVIKKFMSSLNDTKKYGVDAMDEAVVYASDGKYETVSDMVTEMINNIRACSSASEFLSDYCDIDLYNEDTGSIIGSDARGGSTKTAASIVPESGTSVYPAEESYTYNGLTINFPDKDTLTEDQQIIVQGLYSWWMSGALDLVEEATGLSFKDSGATVKEITLGFEDKPSSGTLAYVTHWTEWSGECSKLNLTINMGYYAGIKEDDENGAGNSRSIYLDRVLAHEFTHAVMAANINKFGSLYNFIIEGAAELVHGIDDERTYDIKSLVSSNISTLEQQLSTSGTNYTGIYAYSGGYLFYRYLAKQASDYATEPKTPTETIKLTDIYDIGFISIYNQVLFAGPQVVELSYYGTSTDEVVDVQLANDNKVKLAVDCDGDGKIMYNITTPTNGSEGKQKIITGTTGYYGAEATDTINLTSTSGAAFAYTNDKGNSDRYYTGAGVAAIDGTNAKGNMYIGDVKDVITGSGTNIIWSFSQDKGTITTNHSGTDFIVLSGNFSKDTTVKNFDTSTDYLWAFTTVDKENVFNYGKVNTMQDFTKTFSLEKSGSDVIVSTGTVYGTEYATTLKNVDAVSEAITVVLGDGQDKIKAFAGSSSTADKFCFDTTTSIEAIAYGVDSSDTINLYNISDGDISSVSMNLAGNTAVLYAGSGRLNMTFSDSTEAASAVSGMTFTTTEGTKYSYDMGSHKLIEKV